MINIAETFEKYANEYIAFNINDARAVSKCHDLSAFILLDKLAPTKYSDIICAAEHDEIWLWTDVKKLSEIASEEDIKFLVSCGVTYSSDLDCLGMYV